MQVEVYVSWVGCSSDLFMSGGGAFLSLAACLASTCSATAAAPRKYSFTAVYPGPNCYLIRPVVRAGAWVLAAVPSRLQPSTLRDMHL